MENKQFYDFKKVDELYSFLPQQVKAILLMSEGWLVGSAISKILNGKPIKDFDIIVPSRELYQKIIMVINEYKADNIEINFNSFGGVKIKYGALIIDIWCEELSHFLMNATSIDYICNLKTKKILKLETSILK